MWQRLLDKTIDRVLVQGRISVTFPDGTTSIYGPGGGITAQVTLKTARVIRALCLNPVLAIGEGYMHGEIVIEDDALFDLLTLLVRNQHGGGKMPGWFSTWMSTRRRLRGFTALNSRRVSRLNVAHHYDISDSFYRLFLDQDMQYSCAYFEDPESSLEVAQAAKKQHIARKLRLRSGQTVLDIGCGWGGTALTLARDFGVHVTGITLSQNQFETARARVKAAGLEDLVDIRLSDYRAMTGRYDRVLSIGMLEHVGLRNFGVFFRKVRSVLKDDGIALIHTIGRVAPPSPTNPWIAKYIFPGGYVPTLSDLTPAIERSGLWTADIEVLRGHYGPTLHHWRKRFEAAQPEVNKMYDETFIRMWRFYLVACEMAFEDQSQAVFQFQLSGNQHSVPNTRNYLYPVTS